MLCAEGEAISLTPRCQNEIVSLINILVIRWGVYTHNSLPLPYYSSASTLCIVTVDCEVPLKLKHQHL